jgi:hypothetical protein
MEFCQEFLGAVVSMSKASVAIALFLEESGRLGNQIVIGVADDFDAGESSGW